MGSKSGPKQPDPYKLAEAQFDLYDRAARRSAELNQINRWTPWGGEYWTGDIGGPDRTQHTVYNPVLGSILFGDSYHPHFPGMGSGGMRGSAPSQPGPLAGQLGATPPAAQGPQNMRGSAPSQPGPVDGQLGATPPAAQGPQKRPYQDNQGRDDFMAEDPNDADTLGKGGLIDLVDALTGGWLSEQHDLGTFSTTGAKTEIGALAPHGKGAAGWGTPSYGPVQSTATAFDPGGLDFSGGSYSPDSGDAGTGGGGSGTGDSGESLGGYDGGFGAWYYGGPTGGGSNRMIEPEKPAGIVHEGELVLPHDQPEIQRLASALMGNPQGVRQANRLMGMQPRQGTGGLEAILMARR